ncbi:acyloxyacyl hydrolase [Sphingomonas elodea]|uniref:acyloxyacyl hydrolase n=1 Tax=Sphingomonas elodea TaxID=179878 RepID=UPI00026308FD|nr:acyloxyacyl hydrolase [Sphingomonas elodea]
MIGWNFGVLGASLALVSIPAMAQEAGTVPQPTRERAEVALGVLRHGADFHPLGSKLVFNLPQLPPGQVYDGMEENGTTDVQLLYRSMPLRFLLKPRLTGKLQINTDGRTSFASAGAEWRQHFLRGAVYVQGGMGLTVIDGYRFTPDPFAPGISPMEARSRYVVYQRRTSFGSKVLFNPNASIGVRLGTRWSAELAWEHYSHHSLFSAQNPGIDNVGIRLVRRFGH